VVAQASVMTRVLAWFFHAPGHRPRSEGAHRDTPMAVIGLGAYRRPSAKPEARRRVPPRTMLAAFASSVADRKASVGGPPPVEVSRTALDAAMDRYAAGEDGAFAELYDGLAPRLLAFALRSTRDRARAEDVVQQTLLQMHRARGRFTPGAEVVPWAFAIARRLLIDLHRRGGREVLSRSEEGDGGAALLEAVDAPADQIAIAKETEARLVEVLERLPENQRVAFELIKRDGLSVAEAAQVLGTTSTAVKLRAHRAYEALREVLAELGKGGS